MELKSDFESPRYMIHDITDIMPLIESDRIARAVNRHKNRDVSTSKRNERP